MTKEEFDRILIEEGIDSKQSRNNIWTQRPTDDINEERLRDTAKWFKHHFPRACLEDYP